MPVLFRSSQLWILTGLLGFHLCAAFCLSTRSDAQEQPPPVKAVPIGVSYFWGNTPALTSERFKLEKSRLSALVALVPAEGEIFTGSLEQVNITSFTTGAGKALTVHKPHFPRENYALRAASFEVLSDQMLPAETKAFRIDGKATFLLGWAKELVRSELVVPARDNMIKVADYRFQTGAWEKHEFGEGGRIVFLNAAGPPEIIRVRWVEKSDTGVLSTRYGGQVGQKEWIVSTVDRPLRKGYLEVERWSKQQKVTLPFSVKFDWTGPEEEGVP